MDVVTLLERFAFPVVLAVYLLWQQRDERKRCEERHDALQRRIDKLCGIPPHSDTFPRIHNPE